jgi:hypothetical protein
MYFGATTKLHSCSHRKQVHRRQKGDRVTINECAWETPDSIPDKTRLEVKSFSLGYLMITAYLMQPRLRSGFQRPSLMVSYLAFTVH